MPMEMCIRGFGKMGKHVVLEFMYITQMALCMKETGQMTYKKEKERSCGLMEQSMMEIFI